MGWGIGGRDAGGGTPGAGGGDAGGGAEERWWGEGRKGERQAGRRGGESPVGGNEGG